MTNNGAERGKFRDRDVVARFMAYLEAEAAKPEPRMLISDDGSEGELSQTAASRDIVRNMRQAPDHALMAMLLGECASLASRSLALPKESVMLGFINEEAPFWSEKGRTEEDYVTFSARLADDALKVARDVNRELRSPLALDKEKAIDLFRACALVQINIRRARALLKMAA
jgi:hypothetical protein